MINRILKITSLFFFAHVSIIGNAQSDSTYSIIVAGHAYGAHSGTNIGLHPSFLEKLANNVDSTTKYIFLTGDIVNHSTSESWQQVETELSEIGVNSCYVMGNHDNNSVGYEVFEQKHGGAYYSFDYRNELFIVLNSTESDRSISSEQLNFLNEVLKAATVNNNRVFMFFHEVIWNSIEKYRLVRSNSRSRYDFIKNFSNFWEEVYPVLTAYSEKQFYLFTGDVGGNPDAIAAFYDKWENVTVLSSGMGEVADENYLKVDILPDTVEFTLVPLNDDVQMHPVVWYNVPEAPSTIKGPDKISPPQSGIKYQVDPVFNATGYNWNLNDGMHGQSNSSFITVDFDASFKSGQISVIAENDGFGESGPAVLEIKTDDLSTVYDNKPGSGFTIRQNGAFVQVIINSDKTTKALLRIYNTNGKLLLTDELHLDPGQNIRNINKSFIQKGAVIFDFSVNGQRFAQKAIL